MEATPSNVIGSPLASDDDNWWGEVYQPFPKWVVDIVSQLPCQLYFFGSRTKMFIECSNTESDWDFAVDQHAPNNPKIREKAFELGFRSKVEGYPYEDNMTFECWELKTPEGTIQLVFKVEWRRFIDMWTCLPEWFYRRYFYKKSPDYMGKEHVTKTMAMLYDLHATATHINLEDWK